MPADLFTTGRCFIANNRGSAVSLIKTAKMKTVAKPFKNPTKGQGAGAAASSSAGSAGVNLQPRHSPSAEGALVVCLCRDMSWLRSFR